MTRPERPRGRVEWVLSRPLYRFGRFDLATVPEAQRARALALQIRQWSAFARTGQYVAWAGAAALVWAWDEARVEAAMAAEGVDPRKARVRPETVLRPPRAEGVCLRQCIDGVEGLAWQGGSLVASRWWSEPPPAHEWLAFQRDAGIAPGEQAPLPPGVETVALAAQPWTGPGTGAGILGGRARTEALIVGVGAVALALSTLWYGVAAAKLRLAANERREAARSLEERVRPKQLARVQALEALDRAAALRGLAPYPDQLSLMAAVAQVIAGKNATFREWDFRNGRLRLVLATLAGVPSSEYLKLFQAPDLFRNVQAAPGPEPGTLVVTLEVVEGAQALAGPRPGAAK